jgi:hypothetical protein
MHSHDKPKANNEKMMSRHALAITLDVNKMLAEAAQTGMSASSAALIRNMSDVQVSSLKVLSKMMEQFEVEQKTVLGSLKPDEGPSMGSTGVGPGSLISGGRANGEGGFPKNVNGGGK